MTLALAFFLAAITGPPALAQAPAEAVPLVAPFSAGKAGAAPPPPWSPVQIAANKTPTEYKLVTDEGTIVLNARANAAASGLGHPVTFDIRSAPILEWRWKVSSLIEAADNTDSSKEDSPARIILEFDGNKSKLPLKDRAFFALGKSLAGHDVPYATLMYVWTTRGAVNAVIPNPRTARVQMIAAASGPAGVGAWQTVKRNVVEDFRRAYGEDPGQLLAVGVLTDTDNTGANVEAWYGDIRFLPANP
jgi:Protein of unknown function (DUF3047)